jgi:DNA-binding beta-propeller fold protein YncE
MTVNDALRYGDKFYIVVDGENSVFVTNAKTLKLIQRIDLTSESMLGGTDGVSPRRIAAYDNKIYVSTFGGYVAAIDTVTFSLNKKYKVGSYPEGVTISNGYMFVANSDYGNGNASISMIDLTTGTEQTLRNENIRNPQEIAVAGSDIYFLDFGQYGPAPDYAQEHAGVYRISGTSASDISVTPIIPNATAMACAGYKIYAYCSAFGSSDPVSYHVYNIQSGSSTEFKPEGITIPAAIGVDPLTENVFIAAYQTTTSEYGTYADWSTNGFVNVFSPSLLKIATFDCGVGPTRFAFNLGSEKIIY